jgi:hypothetical protein
VVNLKTLAQTEPYDALVAVHCSVPLDRLSNMMLTSEKLNMYSRHFPSLQAQNAKLFLLTSFCRTFPQPLHFLPRYLLPLQPFFQKLLKEPELLFIPQVV